MSNVMSAIRDTVPIGQFNRGLAGKVFEDVKRTGPKVVIKNNIQGYHQAAKKPQLFFLAASRSGLFFFPTYPHDFRLVSYLFTTQPHKIRPVHFLLLTQGLCRVFRDPGVSLSETNFDPF